MATKITTTLFDDLGDGEADETVSFSLDGVSYEIDLTSNNASELRGALVPYIQAARRVGGRRTTKTTTAKADGDSTTKPSSSDTGKIRQWAQENGYEVSTRGRISVEIKNAYYDAHPDQTPN